MGWEMGAAHTTLGVQWLYLCPPSASILAVPQRWLSPSAGCHLPASSAMPPAGAGTHPEEQRGNTSRRDGMGKGYQVSPPPIQHGRICPSCPHTAQDVLQRSLADQPFPTLTHEKGNLSVV